MAHMVTCIHCKQRFNRDKEQCIQVSARRYAHESCEQKYQEEKKQEDQEKEKLDKYIMDLFHIDFIKPKVKKQINLYINDYHYSYSGIRKTLMYYYEVKTGSIEKANEGIGIVPYVYEEAFKYYYNLWSAINKNKDKNFNDFIPTVKEVTISSPNKRPPKKKLFTFLEKDEEIKK